MDTGGDLQAAARFLKWRRATLAGECMGDINLLHQEYPLTPQQGFIGHGSKRFARTWLDRLPIREGRRGFFRQESRWRRNLVFVDDGGSPLVIFRDPIRHNRHVLSLDPSEGIPSDVKDIKCEHCMGAGGDQASIQVFDIDVPAGVEQIACLHARIGEEEILDPLLSLAEWAGMPYIVVETVGGHGTHVLEKLRKVYPRERLFRELQRNGRRSRDYGLKVHAGNRIRLLADVAGHLQGERLIIHDETTQHQLAQVELGRGGRYEAHAGHKDDAVFSLIGIVQGWMTYPDQLDPDYPRELGSRRERWLPKRRWEQPVNPDEGGFY